MSYATAHRIAVAEALRLELAVAINKVYQATHCVARKGTIYTYGSRRECDAFAGGLRGVVVRVFTDDEKHAEAAHKRRVYR